MKYSYLLSFVLFFLVAQMLPAQTPIAEGCDGQRYLLDLFPSVKKTTIKYGSNMDNAGLNLDLYIDVYEPVGDVQAKRPVVMMAHGGSFISGNKTDMKDFCEGFARKGYVAVSVQYRLWNFAGGLPDAGGFMSTCARAISDYKGAMRWLKLDADNGNQFRIDPELFFVGGVSAGSVTALHMIYMDASDLLTPQLDQIVQQQGGWDGNTGSPESFSYPVSALGVIDIVGALFDSTFIQTYDPYLMSIHGTADATVPYGAGAFLGQIQLNGSSSLYHRAQEVGVPVYFVSVPGGTHSLSEATSLPYVAEYQIGIITRMEGIVCQTISANNDLSATEHKMQISPNPVSEEANIDFTSEIDEKGVFILYNSIGQIALQQAVQSNSQIQLNVSNLAPGVYYCLSTWRQGQAVVQKLVIQ